MVIRRILVVDNDAAILTFVSMFLSKRGYEVQTAEDGLSALRVLEGFVPDLMIIDLIMPNISGDKLCSIVRGMEAVKGSYLVLLSAISAEQEGLYLEYGFDACIAKGPLKQTGEHLLTLLRELEAASSRGEKNLVLGHEGLARREITKELLSNRRHYELMLGHMSEGILEVTGDGDVTYANAMAISLLGISEQHLLGSQILTLFAKADRDRIQKCFEGSPQEPSSIGDDQPLSVGARFVALTVVPVPEEASPWFIVIVTDVTERHKAREQLQRAHDELGRRVRDRTAALTLANKRLGAEIGERKRAEKLLRASLEQKELLLREVHHRVKNNLQIISSLIKLPLRHSKLSPLAGIVQETQNRIRSIWLIHEKLYLSENLQIVDFSEYVRTLTQNLFESYSVKREQVGLEFDCDAVTLDIDTAVPCGLIVNEVVSNSIRHAFPDGRHGVVAISLKRTDSGGCRLTVRDNGVGLPPEADPESRKTLGISIVEALVRQIHGSMRWDRDHGTSFSVEFARRQ